MKTIPFILRYRIEFTFNIYIYIYRYRRNSNSIVLKKMIVSIELSRLNWLGSFPTHLLIKNLFGNYKCKVNALHRLGIEFESSLETKRKWKFFLIKLHLER